MSVNIFKKRHPAVANIFASVKSLKKILLVPIDYAKSTHKVLFINGDGDQCRAPFDVHNTNAGFELLLQSIKRTCKKRRIAAKHVIIGGEGLPCFARNFIHAVDNHFLVLNIHAKEAKEMRQTEQASTDKLDLVGIAKSMLHGSGKPIGKQRFMQNNICNDDDISLDAPVYEDLFADQAPLQILTRHRAKLVLDRTGCSNRIHTLIDQLFPGFLDAKSPLSAFSKASVELMKAPNFSAQQVAKAKPRNLSKNLKEWGTHQPEESALMLIEMAKDSLSSAPSISPNLQIALASQVIHYEGLKKSISHIEAHLHASLVSSPASLLLSLPGIGVVLAAGIYAELGSSLALRPLTELCSYSGIIPRVKQSGGPDKPARAGKVRKPANRILKNYLVRAAMKMQAFGPPHLQEAYQQLKANGQHADFIIARRLLRSFKYMMIHQTIYLPPVLRHLSQADPALLTNHLNDTREKIAAKWQRTTQAEEAMSSDHPLGRWWETVKSGVIHLRSHEFEDLTIH